MLVGRERECRAIAGLLDGARAGRSGSLLVVGEPGIGKSALLEEARGLADGMIVLVARGLETETEFTFSGLHDLVRPILDLRRELPGPQRSALDGALAIGPPVPGDRFAVSAALLGLLGAAAEERPVLVLVDDLQWLDRPSADAVLFAARRLSDEGVAVIVSARPEAAHRGIVAGLDELRLAGLGPAAARSLLHATRLEVAPGVVEALVSATGGNALALLEGIRTLTEEQRLGREPLAGPLPLGPAIEERFRASSAHLSERGRAALLVAATAGEGVSLPTLRAALAGLDLTLEDLEAAERGGAVTLSRAGVRFPHPLLRSACYHAASPADRRGAHRALARAIDGQESAEARAWHLAAAALEPDEEVASQLEEVGRDARGRAGHSAAASAFLRAADLSPDPRERARRRVEAARDAHLAGEPDRALGLVDAALADGAPPGERFRAEHLRAQIEAWRAPAEEIHARLTREAEQATAVDPELAARMLGDAALLHLRLGDVRIGLRTAERAARVAEDAGVPHSRAEWVLGMGLIVAGRSPEAGAIVEHWTRVAETAEHPLEMLGLFQTLPRVLMWLEDYDRSRALAQRLVESARETAPAVVPIAVATLAEIDLRTGDLTAALAGASAGVALARATDQQNALGFCLAGIARVEAIMGRSADCRAHCAEARETGLRLGRGTPVTTLGEPALGLLALAEGDAEEAAQHLEAVARACEERGLEEPAMVQYAPNLIEALVRCHRRAEAEAALDRLAARAERTGRRWALAAAARCRGLLADEGAFAEEFSGALALHDLTPMPWERARTHLCFGERLRRARRRAEARTHLRAALSEFERLGATPWAARAEAELGVSGETARRRTEPASDELTAQELQVALMVAGGATNKEAGARLFLSAKTIEAHLGRIYRKLGVRSRTELAARVSRGGLAGAAEARARASPASSGNEAPP